jgi:enolase
MAVPSIRIVDAMEILDCRLEPTLRVTVETDAGVTGSADVPAGRSRGRREAMERRDSDDRYGGRGVRTAAATVRDAIAPELVGRDPTNQRGIDETLVALDGTDEKSNLGGNTLTGVSLAVLKAGAASVGRSLYRHVAAVADAGDPRVPIPFFDLIEGGELAATDLAFQEHQVVPTGAESVADALRACAEVYETLGDLLADEWGPGSRNVGVEGGYTPQGMADPRDALDAELSAVEACGYDDVFDLALDVAATHVYDPDGETYTVMDRTFSRAELIEFYEELVEAYPIVSIEDPLVETDFDGYRRLTNALDVQIVGDDLFVTQPDRVRLGVDAGAANALLLKVNQVGTVTEALEAARVARRADYAVQVSERSGQTPDTWLADLTVGLGAGQIKTGVTRGERTEQYNRLLEIEATQGGPGYAEWVAP